MGSINGKTVLYHGTKHYFEDFDLSKAKPFKDFGKGFYLTSYPQQAYAWASGKASDTCYLYEYSIDIPDEADFKILALTEYNTAWLDYISTNRKEDCTNADYDIVYDKLADGASPRIPQIIDKYKAGKISDTIAIKKLKWKRTSGDQYCFKTPRALECLRREKCYCFKKNTQGQYEQMNLESPQSKEA